MGGCGAVAALAHYFFTNLGFESYLVDGDNDKGRTHAWIALIENNQELLLDFTMPDFKITADYTEELHCKDWWQIKDILFKKHTGEYWATSPPPYRFFFCLTKKILLKT